MTAPCGRRRRRRKPGEATFSLLSFGTLGRGLSPQSRCRALTPPHPPRSRRGREKRRGLIGQAGLPRKIASTDEIAEEKSRARLPRCVLCVLPADQTWYRKRT